MVPPIAKSHGTLTSFKAALDKFLQTFPSTHPTPPTPGLVAQNRNSILMWVGGIRWCISASRNKAVENGDARYTWPDGNPARIQPEVPEVGMKQKAGIL